MPLEDAGEAVLHLGGGFTRSDPHGAGDVGRTVGILPARIEQVEHIGRDNAVGLLLGAIMDDGAIRSCAADRIEAQIPQASRRLAEGEQLRGGREFRLASLRSFEIDPVQEPHQRSVGGMLSASISAWPLLATRLASAP